MSNGACGLVHRGGSYIYECLASQAGYFLGKAIDKAVPLLNLIGPAINMAKEAYQQSGNQPISKLEPNTDASGTHTTFSRDNVGNIYKYETYDSQQMDRWESMKQFDGGKPDGSPGASFRTFQ